MLRISKLADYGILLLTYMVREGDRKTFTARDLASATQLPLPTVGKLLKALSRQEVLSSQRGASGGYQLARPPARISIAEVITALDGPISVTECGTDRVLSTTAKSTTITKPSGGCEKEMGCPTKSNWRKINGVVKRALDGLSLEDMSFPLVGSMAAPEAVANFDSPLKREKIAL